MANPIQNEIITAIGGNRFFAMTGTKIQYGEEYSITFKLTKNKANSKWLKIALNGLDLYDMTFTKLAKGELVTVKEYNNAYADQLQELFTETTGLYTHL